MTVTVTPVNDAPTAVDDAIAIQEDTQLTFDPRLNDSKGAPNESSQTLTVTAVSQAAHGSAFLSTGLVSYIPAENYVGQDTFDYTVCDGETPALCDVGTATITLTPVNDPPRASLDSYTVTAAGATLDVRENDSPGPVNDGPQTLAPPTIHTPPQTGAATANPDGTITLCPGGDRDRPGLLLLLRVRQRGSVCPRPGQPRGSAADRRRRRHRRRG